VKTLGEFQPKKYKISRNLAENNYKSRQNTAHWNISRISWFSWMGSQPSTCALHTMPANKLMVGTMTTAVQAV